MRRKTILSYSLMKVWLAPKYFDIFASFLSFFFNTVVALLVYSRHWNIYTDEWLYYILILYLKLKVQPQRMVCFFENEKKKCDVMSNFCLLLLSSFFYVIFSHTEFLRELNFVFIIFIIFFLTVLIYSYVKFVIHE